MIAANLPIQRPANARLLAIDPVGEISVLARRDWTNLLRPGDIVIANDAGTVPASLMGRHAPTGAKIEIRLAGRASLAADDVTFQAVAFGEGDYHIRTEDRALPPLFTVGDKLSLGPLTARVEAILGHPRLITISFEADVDAVWAGIARHGHPVQYAHIEDALHLWDVWTPIAGLPVAFEAPSAGFMLDWAMLRAIRERGAALATLTHAAGLSSTGDPTLDMALPLREPYYIPGATAEAIARASGRVIAIGTTVTRALEHAAQDGEVRSGSGVADQRIGRDTMLVAVDAILSGTHEPETSHYQLLRAFTNDRDLSRADRRLEKEGFRTHEFGDSVLIERRSNTCKTSTKAPIGSQLIAPHHRNHMSV